MKADYSKENLEKLTKEAWCFNDLGLKLGLKYGKKKRLKEKLDKFGIDYSHFRKVPLKIAEDDVLINETRFCQKIRQLRQQNKSYAEISKEIGCSRSTVGYYLRSKSREKTRKRQLNRPHWLQLLIKKLYYFQKKNSET